MTDITIKEAVPEDAEQRIQYSKQIGGETDNLSFGKEGFLISIDEEKDYIRAVHEDSHSVNFFAWKDGKIIGDVSLNGLPRRMSHRAELGITVVKAEWNNGVGSMLLQKAIDWAKENNISIINLEVRSDNRSAIHVYDKFGFQKAGTLPAYFKINEEYIDFDIMYLDLR